MSKILVIGESCQDIFVYGECSRLCPEKPVPILDMTHVETNDGMAGNVYRNIKSLGAEVHLITNPNYENVKKIRYIEDKTNHLFVRVDSGEKIERVVPDALYESRLRQYDAVIISDYNKGFLTVDDIITIGKRSKLTFLDTKKTLGFWSGYVDFIKINRGEYEKSKDGIKENFLDKKIITTLGSEGCKFRDKIYPVKEVEIRNLSGAGDSFISALVVKYLETNNIEQSLIAANEAATIVVQKKGVSLIK